MALPLTPPLVLAALLMAGPAATVPADQPTEPSPEPQPTAGESCPAYLGPQCGSPEHEQWASGQALADLALHVHRHAA